MTPRLHRHVLVWLIGLALCAAVALRAHYTADMSAFLPRSPTPAQQLLVDQLTEGVLSRLLLVGIEGASPEARADLSRALARRLDESGQFRSVQNGDPAALAVDRDLLFNNRYLLSRAVTPEHFSVAGLREAIGNSIDLLGSPAGMMLKKILPQDPTGEIVELIGSLDTGGGPASAHGAWVSKDGQRAILMLQTRASGSDTDAQEVAIARIHSDFAAVAASQPDARVLVSGAAVFAVKSRAAIQSEAVRLSTAGSVMVICLLLLIYRSPTAVVLGLIPVASGALAGIAAVALGFGTVHGLTIGFGTTLIGEAVDYSIYYFVQSDGAERDGSPGNWMARFWPTIRLGVLTSVIGFASLLFSGFPGLAQLGLYSIAGLVTAAAITRFVLPHLRPAGLPIRDIRPVGVAVAGLWQHLTRLRPLIAVLAVAAIGVLVTHHDRVWSATLSGLSPVSDADQALDQRLRADLGAPDLRYLVVLKAADREAALAAAEKVGARLDGLVAAGTLGGYESPARFLPSVATQAARQHALPERAELARRLDAALEGQPLSASRLTPFLDAVDAARRQPLLTPDSLRGSTLALAVDSLLLQRPTGWTVLMPLRAPRRRPAPRPRRRARRAGGRRQRRPVRGHLRRILRPLPGLPRRSDPAVAGRQPRHRPADGRRPAQPRPPGPGARPAADRRTAGHGRPHPGRRTPHPAASGRHVADRRGRLQLRPVLRPPRRQPRRRPAHPRLAAPRQPRHRHRLRHPGDLAGPGAQGHRHHRRPRRGAHPAALGDPRPAPAHARRVLTSWPAGSPAPS